MKLNNSHYNLINSIQERDQKQMINLDQQLSQENLDEVYHWVDTLQLSRPKKNISRDYSDAVLMAETVAIYYPKLVELHNYPATNSIKSKITNWKTLSGKVLSKFGLALKFEDCQKLASSTPMCVEALLYEFMKLCTEMEHEQKANEENSRGIRQQTQQYQRKGELNRLNSRKQNVVNRGENIKKVDELRQILKLIKQKIASVQRVIQRKDAEIKELEDMIQIGI